MRVVATLAPYDIREAGPAPAKFEGDGFDGLKTLENM